jgi:hypothetical protein
VETERPTPDQIAAVKGHLIVCYPCTRGEYCAEGIALRVEWIERRWEEAAGIFRDLPENVPPRTP